MTAYNVIDPAKMAAGQSEDISTVLANFQAIASVLNGGIKNDNIAADAAIAASKISGSATDGWQAITEMLTFGAADAPSYTVTAPGDLTTKYWAGQKWKLTHSATVKYFIVTAVSHAAGTTTITLYGGTDYTLAAGAITLPYYSLDRVPQGFPMSPAKWRVQADASSNDNQGAVVAGTWYNIGPSIVVPIGAWRLGYSAAIFCDGDDQQQTVDATLATVNNNQTDYEFTTHGRVIMTPGQGEAAGFPARIEKWVVLAAKTTYYLNLKSDNGGSTIWILGASQKSIIFAECAYL